MANPTFLDLKNMVANQLGKDDGATYDSKREKLINRARRKFYSARRWSFLDKVAASVTITAQVGPLPSDYNNSFDPLNVYTYTSTTKYCYEKVEWDDILSYGQDIYVYAINKQLGQIKINQTAVTAVSLDYTYLPSDRPADNTEDASVEAAPDITALGYLCISMWWLASERSTAKFQLFDDKYKEEFANLVNIDMQTKPVALYRPRAAYLNKGYRGRTANWY